MLAPALLMAFYALPWLTMEILGIALPEAILFYGFIFGVYILTGFYIHGLFMAYKIVLNGEKGEFYSDKTIALLRKVMKDALAMAIIAMILAGPLFVIAQLDDAPGLILVGMLTGYGALLVTALARLLMNEIKRKTNKEVVA